MLTLLPRQTPEEVGLRISAAAVDGLLQLAPILVFASMRKARWMGVSRLSMPDAHSIRELLNPPIIALEVMKVIKRKIVKKKTFKRRVTKMNCWDLIEQVVGNCDRVLLWGVSGTGKSWAARKGNLRDGGVFSVSLTDDTPAAELRGHYGVVDGSFKWLDGPCTLAWRQGCRCVLNELEKASGDAQTFLLGFLDDMEIAQQTLPNNETIYPKAGFHVVATMNGNPDEDLLPALRDRFAVCIHVDEVAPAALAKLPEKIRKVAKNTGILGDSQRRISIRVWNEFSNLREKIGDQNAAQAVFGNRARTVLDHLKLVG